MPRVLRESTDIPGSTQPGPKDGYNSAPNEATCSGSRDLTSPRPSHEGRQAMSISFKKTLLAFAGILSIGILSPVSTALAQAPQASAPSSVLPTGGGAALLDPSDTAFLLLDHQA